MTAPDLDRLADRLRADPALADRVRTDVPLGPLTTYRVGGAAWVAVTVTGPQDAVRVAEALAEAGAGVDVLVVGRGSNLLVADRGFAGVAVLVADGFDEIDVAGATVRAEAGVALPRLARATVAAGLRGFEWAVGVPGSIGGAVRMNAGGHGSDMAATLRTATVADLRAGVVESWSAERLALGYRRSSLAAHHLVVDAQLVLTPGDPGEAEALLAGIVRWRRTHQPGGQNAGSVFTNPPGDSAGRLIDTAGGKGLRVGSAEVSTKHANFIQADPGGSADDVVALMVAVRELVRQHHGVALEVETRLAGFAEAPW